MLHQVKVCQDTPDAHSSYTHRFQMANGEKSVSPKTSKFHHSFSESSAKFNTRYPLNVSCVTSSYRVSSSLRGWQRVGDRPPLIRYTTHLTCVHTFRPPPLPRPPSLPVSSVMIPRCALLILPSFVPPVMTTHSKSGVEPDRLTY